MYAWPWPAGGNAESTCAGIVNDSFCESSTHRNAVFIPLACTVPPINTYPGDGPPDHVTVTGCDRLSVVTADLFVHITEAAMFNDAVNGPMSAPWVPVMLYAPGGTEALVNPDPVMTWYRPLETVCIVRVP